MVEDLIIEVLAADTAREAICVPLEALRGWNALNRMHCPGNLLAALGAVLAKLLEEILQAEGAVVFREILLERLRARVTLEAANMELAIVDSEDELLVDDFATLVAFLGGCVDEMFSTERFILMHVKSL